AVLALIVVLVGCGVLSFNYSRDRLGGMAAVFYAVTAFFALRAAALRTLTVPRGSFVGATLALSALVLAWHVRAVGTIEWTRHTSRANQIGWLVQLPSRRLEFADRPIYLQIMNSMIAQGTDPSAPQPTRYPRWIARSLGPQ